MEFIWHLWKLGTDYSAIITANGHWYFISYRKDHASILQCLQQMTNYIPILTGKDQIYYNVCNEGPNILQSLQQRYNYIPILTGKDQI